MALKPVQWDVTKVQLGYDLAWPSVTYLAPPWPACAACGNTATTITVGKGVPLSDTEQTFTIAAYECHACSLELHALPH